MLICNGATNRAEEYRIGGAADIQCLRRKMTAKQFEGCSTGISFMCDKFMSKLSCNLSQDSQRLSHDLFTDAVSWNYRNLLFHLGVFPITHCLSMFNSFLICGFFVSVKSQCSVQSLW